MLSIGTRLGPGPRHLAVAIVAALVSFASGSGQNVPFLKVMISGGFRAAYQDLVPELFQQLRELRPIAGIDIVGPIPPEAPLRS